MSQTNAYRQSKRLFVPAALCVALCLTACASEKPRLPDLRSPTAADMPVPRVANDVHGRAVRNLASHDFEVRTRAARDLVTAGDSAVPALGRAGDLSVPVAGGMRVSATQSVLRSILADSDEAALERHLGSPWPHVRRVAAEELGRRERWSSIPRLIERLDDADLEVRAASAISLRRVTNQFLDYGPDDSLGDRREAADRWRTWWSDDGRARAQQPGGGPTASAP